ncbi:amidohydrolase family protein [Thermodesulfobacteriota bacterium]
MTDSTLIIDVQVHAYERDHPGRPWQGFLHGPSEVTGDDMVAAMDTVGVDGVLLVSPFSLYRYDASYAMEVHSRYPDRFGLIKPFDPRSATVAAEIEKWAGQPGVVGARIILAGQGLDASDAGVNQILEAGSQFGLPINILCWNELTLFGELARKHPDTQFVIDHLGLPQPFEPPAPAQPFSDLEKVIALAAYDNVAIKISGVCTLSHQTFPYEDIWKPLAEIFNAFGFNRCMWGTDWTRAVNLLTYKEGVDAFRLTDHLSDSEKRALMGGTLTKIYNWSPG